MQGFRQQNNMLLWEQNHEMMQIQPWGRDSLRVRATISAGIRDDLVSVLLPPAETDAQITIGAEGATIRNGALTASISPEGFIRFSNTANGTELLAEESPVRATRLPSRSFKAVHSELFHLEVRFRAYKDERLYGLGQHQHGRLDQKGCTIDLIQRNTEVSIPFLFSSRGYGFLWHNPGIGRVELGYNTTRWVAEATPQLDYWITAGATPAEIMEHYADATGHAPELPAWAAGFWQSKLRYRTQNELLSVAREYKRRGLPLAVIVIDFFNWTLQGDWRFDPELWPDPAGMVSELEGMGVKLMVSIWPTVNPVSEKFPMDPDNLRFHLGNGLTVANAYPLLHARGFYEGMRDAGETAILNLCRSAWAGSQRYGAAVWSGDINSTFEAFQAQVRAGLNIGLSGIPWWTTDIGGFYGGDPESPAFRELLIRWFQYSTFCPLFRLHGYRLPTPEASTMISTGGPNEAWSFGDEVYTIIKDLLFLRERLRPYILEQMHLAHEKGIPPMRPLFFDFLRDETCASIDDQFLFGPDLLVAPVLTEGACTREVYLPAGTTWTDAWSRQTFEGGQHIVAEAPLDRIPLYLRADAQLPIGNA